MPRIRIWFAALFAVALAAWWFRLLFFDVFASVLDPPLFVNHRCWFDAPEGRSVDCGYLYASLKRVPQPEGVVRLPVAILRAELESDKTPILYLAGGPSSAFGLPKLTPLIWANKLKGRPWLQDRDLILFDYRGLRTTKRPLACRSLRHFWTSWFAYDEFVERFERCVQYLHGMGRELSGYNTLNIALDAHELVGVLGLDRVNVWSESYGTRVAFEWMRTHPEDLRAVTMHAVLPPEAGNWGDSFPKNLYRTLNAVFSLCAEDKRCRAKYPDLKKKLHEAIESLNDNPFEVQLDVRRFGIPNRWLPTRTPLVDDVIFVETLAHAATSWEGIRKIPMLIEAALNGRKEPVARFLEERIFSTALLFVEPVHFNVLRCNDLGPIDQTRRAQATRDVEFFGQWLEGEDVCARLPYELRPALAQTRVESDVSTLMLAGALDPLTPPEWAQHALEGLSRGQLYVFPFRSHQVGQTSCAAQVTQSFLEDPEGEAEYKCVEEAKILGAKYELFH